MRTKKLYLRVMILSLLLFFSEGAFANPKKDVLTVKCSETLSNQLPEVGSGVSSNSGSNRSGGSSSLIPHGNDEQTVKIIGVRAAALPDVGNVVVLKALDKNHWGSSFNTSGFDFQGDPRDNIKLLGSDLSEFLRDWGTRLGDGA